MSSAAELVIPQQARVRLDPEAMARLPTRQGRWAAAQAAALAACLGVPALAGWPDLGFGLALSVGAATAMPSLSAAGLVAAATLAGVLLPGLFGAGDSTLSLLVQPDLASSFDSRGLAGVQVWAGGAAMGVALGALDGGPRSPWRLLQLALSGATVVGLGWWAAQTLVPGSWVVGARALAQGALCALLASQVLLIAALRTTTTERVPRPAALHASLDGPYRTPALRAAQLDAELAEAAPDETTRDGLGEVAVWVVRLQSTLQGLDQSLDEIDADPIAPRMATLAEEADAAEDDFVRDRKLATLRHLEQLARHRSALATERTRTAALSDYALAFLEEARAGLTLARMQPGDHTPVGLQDVLDRLRTQGAEREARRQTAREVGVLSG